MGVQSPSTLPTQATPLMRGCWKGYHRPLAFCDCAVRFSVPSIERYGSAWRLSPIFRNLL